MYRYGLIGNCNSSALVSELGSVEWLCFPRPDSPPIFGRLLDPDGGHFSIRATDETASTHQHYVANTNILVTQITTADGSSFRVVDFFPRFYHRDSIVRPPLLHRIVEPVGGNPVIQVECRPVQGWTKAEAVPTLSAGSISYEFEKDRLSLVTNCSIDKIISPHPIPLNETLFFSLAWNGEPSQASVSLASEHLKQTSQYWQTWVKHCSIPTLFQETVIRSALVLKLHCYEPTGAILAALTTSLPEESGGTRNWDYRYCWLRDAYFHLTAFRNLGHFEEMEGFLTFLLNIAEQHGPKKLRPVYRLDQSLPLPEIEHPNWRGFDGSLPVRSNNQAAEHIQNDVYGEMVLTLAPIFLDERFRELRGTAEQSLIEELARSCMNYISEPDAGLWELRHGWQEHSFSNLMCWAGIDRALVLQQRGYLNNLGSELFVAKQRAEKALEAAVVDGSLRNGPTDSSLDSALLLLPILNHPNQQLSVGTVDAISHFLRYQGSDCKAFLYRYLRPDDFGKPKAAFVICSFWLVQALAKVGRKEEALQIMQQTLRASNSLGLIAEHYIPGTKTQTGNFPQAYSHAGVINGAFAVSPDWHRFL